MAKVSEHSRLDDIQGAMSFLNVSRATVYRLVDAGELVTLKIGRKRMVTHESLVAFVDRQIEAGRCA